MNVDLTLFIESFGLTPEQFGVVLLAISMLAQLLARVIPDDSTGLLAVVLRVARFVGLYTKNR